MSKLYINGQWKEGNGKKFQSINPATGNIVWEGNAANETQVTAAVQSAKDAAPSWAATPLNDRIAMLAAFNDRVSEHKTELATLIARESGKTLWDATGEAGATIGKLNFSLKAYEERTGERHSEMTGFTASLRHRPHGVMAVYGPYNFPAHLPNGHIMPALLAGNTIVFKPSEQTPAVGEWMVAQWEAAGLPNGVINLVQGERETGIALANANIDGLLFTGSSATGAMLHKQFAGRPNILLALELGGNNPLIVHNISDIPAAVYEVMQSAYITSGQRCTCARRLIVTEGTWAQPLLEQLTKATSQIKVGAYSDDPEPFMGPIISNQEADKLIAAHDALIAGGGVSLTPLKRLRENLPYLAPGLVDVTNCSNRPDEERFGPLLQVIRVRDLDAAISEANNTRYGLSAGVFTDDKNIYEQCMNRMSAGIINWNKQTTGASGMAPFGGIGCSGNHHAAGYYSADYCAYPVASVEASHLTLPDTLSPGITL